MKTTAVLLATLLAAGPSLAETIGTVTASFDGGEERTFHVTELNGESQSFWLQTLPGTLNGASFNIWANPDEGANSTKDVIVLGAVMMRGPGGFIPIAEVQYLEDYFAAYWTNPEEGTVMMDLTKVEEDGDRLIVEGTFSAPVFYTENASNPQTDTSRQRTIAGSFSASLPKE